MKEFVKLIKEFRTTSNKKASFLVILERSGKIQLPIYSLVQLLNSINKKPAKVISSEGWVEKDIDLKINKLQKERNDIEKEKADLNKARIEFEKTLKENSVKPKQIISQKNHGNSNTETIKNTNISKQTSKGCSTSSQRQDLPHAKEVFFLGLLSFLSFLILLANFGFRNITFLSLLTSIITLIISLKGGELYKKNKVPGKFSDSSYSKIIAGRIFAYIPLGIAIVVLFFVIIDI